MSTIEYIVRGIVINTSSEVLLLRTPDDYYMLPGGHVEFGELSRYALLREFTEELGVKLSIDELLGCDESIFDQGDIRHHEVVLYYRASLFGDPVLRDTTQEIAWVPVCDLESVTLLPESAHSFIEKVSKSD